MDILSQVVHGKLFRQRSSESVFPREGGRRFAFPGSRDDRRLYDPPQSTADGPEIGIRGGAVDHIKASSAAVSP